MEKFHYGKIPLYNVEKFHFYVEKFHYGKIPLWKNSTMEKFHYVLNVNNIKLQNLFC